MSFYQMMQLDPASNRKLRADAAPETVRKLRLAMVARSALIVLFAIVFIGVMSTWFGAENSSMRAASSGSGTASRIPCSAWDSASSSC